MMIAARTFMRRMRRDHRGAAAVEFAFIAPVMILFYCGMVEYCQAMMAERKAIRTASAVGDLVAQASTITASQTGGIDDIFAIAKTLMAPFPVTGGQLKLCVAHLSADATAKVTVDWSRNQSDTACPAEDAVYTGTPANLIAANQSLVMSRVKYEYASPIKYLLKTNPTFTKAYYLRPRKSAQITCATC